jgi:hypothetical protein
MAVSGIIGNATPLSSTSVTNEAAIEELYTVYPDRLSLSQHINGEVNGAQLAIRSCPDSRNDLERRRPSQLNLSLVIISSGCVGLPDDGRTNPSPANNSDGEEKEEDDDCGSSIAGDWHLESSRTQSSIESGPPFNRTHA